MIGVEPGVGLSRGKPHPMSEVGNRERGFCHLSWEGLRAWGGAGPVRLLRVPAVGSAGRVRETEATTLAVVVTVDRWGGSHLDEASPGPLLIHRRSIFFHRFNRSDAHS